MNLSPRERSSALVRLRRMDIDTYLTPVVYMRRDCGVCRSEGFESQARIEVRRDGRTVIATLNVVGEHWLAGDEAGLSEAAWRLLDASEGDTAELLHPEPLESLASLRAKVYGNALGAADWNAVVQDIAAGRYSDLELAAFVTACAGNRMRLEETISLTRAMVDVGQRLSWPGAAVVDKHCIGGLPGNRTTLVVVPIVAAAGLQIPKTSSRAITSPAGTADAMETLAPVNLDLAAMRGVVEREGGCIVWGGAARLSPADDVLIRVERPLDFDSEDQLVASVLSKKLAAGSTHVLVDLPVGETAKVRTPEAAAALTAKLETVGRALGLEVRCLQTPGHEPVGSGIGPALEAREALRVLQRDRDASPELRERSLSLAAALLEFGGRVPPGAGRARAAELLDSGAAWRKFMAIAQAQGGLREPPVSRFRHEITSRAAGTVSRIDNRRLARLAKLAGAPRAPAAGLEIRVRIGDAVSAGQPLLVVNADTAGELSYALDYALAQPDIIGLAR